MNPKPPYNLSPILMCDGICARPTMHIYSRSPIKGIRRDTVERVFACDICQHERVFGVEWLGYQEPPDDKDPICPICGGDHFKSRCALVRRGEVCPECRFQLPDHSFTCVTGARQRRVS